MKAPSRARGHGRSGGEAAEQPGGDGDGDGDGDLPTVGVADAVCSTEVSCVVDSGAEEDEDWLEDSRARCENEGFSFVDREGTWETSSTCPEADYFAACIGDDREEYFLLSDTDRNLNERQEHCEASGGTWEWYDEVDPRAYHSEYGTLEVGAFRVAVG